MKQTKKYIITMAALLLSVTIWAQGKFTYIYQLNGASSTAAAAGTISGGISENGTATLTLTPAQGNYINADYITVVKTLSGGNAQTRIGTAENVSITASNANADPSETTTYTFAVEDANYDYEVTANFQSRTNISSATVALAATSYTYDGQEHKPAVSSVKLGETTLGTNDYTVSYADDCTNVGTVTVTIAGVRTYTGTTTATYSITNATMTVTATGYNGTYDGNAHGVTVTIPEGAVIKYGTTEGTYNLETSPEYTDAGSYTVYYQVTRANYQTVTGSAAIEIAKATPSITFDKESYSATYGETFTAPTATTNPEELTITATNSSNTQVATVTNGVITIVGVGETTITVSFAGNNNYNAATATYTLNVAAGTTTGITATGYTGTYDGKAHGITVAAPQDAVIKYGTTEGTYNLENSPEYTDAGSYTVYYQVIRTNYQTVTGSAAIEIAKATPSITFDKESYSATYGETFNAPTPSTSPEGLDVTATSSSNTQVATVTDGVIEIVGIGETTITVSFAGNNNYETATATYTLNVAAGTTTGITATGYTGTYDGKAHGITVAAPEDAVIKYGTTEGTYNLETSPEYTDAGSYTVYYQVTRANYQTVTGSAAIEIAKATPSITFDKQSYSATFGETFTAPTPTTNPEGLTITATSSSNTQVATIADGVITITGIGETTITVSFAGNNNYNAATATYTLNVAAGTTTGITATGYTGTYDGKAHGITVAAPEDAVIKYDTTEGTYNLETSPVYTDAGSYTVYYQVTRANYQTVTGSAAVEIEKATPSITFDKQSYSATYGETFNAPTPSTSPEGLDVTATSSSNTQVATITDGVITITGVGETTITVSFAGNNNYEKATATYKLNVAAGSITGITATGYTGTYDGKAHGITVTAPEGATIKYGTKKGTYDLDASPTYTDAGSYMVHYQVERNNYNTIADSAKVEITKATPSITFDKESYSATYGETFNAPTPSTSPEGLDVTATSSSNTQVATITDGVIKIAGIGETTITVSFAGNTNYEAATATYILNVAAGTSTDVIATGYTGVYDGKAHGITVSAPDGSTIKYGTEKGKYELDKSPTYTDAGTYWIHYQVERTNYTTIADSAKVEITKATPSITFDKESYSTTYGETFTAPTPSTNPEGLTVSATSSSNTQVATIANGVISIIGVGETTITVSFAGNKNYEAATATYKLNIAAGTITGVTVTGYTDVYDGKAHGIKVEAPEGATIKYGTKKGTYNLDASPTYTDAGSYMVHYQVERTNFATIADSAKVEITKATPSITFDKESYSATYGEEFTAPTPSTSPEGLDVTATSSSNTQVATITDGVIKIVGIGETTITVSFAGNNNYEATTATYKLNVAAGSITGITATGFSGTYDGKAHGIKVSAPEGATIKYGTKKGTYDLDASPTYTDAGTYMVHYQVERTNYTTIADSAKVAITKATPSITFDKESYSATYGEEFTAPTPSTNPEGLTVTATSSSNTQVATVADGVITITGVGETTITVSFAGNNNYNAATATYTLNVAAGTSTDVIATGYTGVYDGKAHGITVSAPDGSTIKYGTEKGKYELDKSPTYTDAGTYWIHYQVERTNYATIADSAKVAITKATPSITFDKESYSATFGEAFTAPTPSTNPEGLTVTVTASSNTKVATVTDGVIEIVGIGETTITVSFAGNNNYEKATASYVLTVNKPKAKTYNLWIGETQVTEDNAEDILDAGNDPELPLYLYNAKNNTLIISKDQRGTAVIESRLPELKVYLLETCKIKSIFYNNLDDKANTGTLTFTCNGNVPGKLYIENNEGESAITGFSDISYEYQLTVIEPDSTVYRKEQMMYAEKDEEGNPTGNFIVANKVTIGQTIVPTTKEETITFSEDQLVEKDEEGNVKTDEEGNPISADLSNFTYAPTSETGEDSQPKILITLNPESGDGYGDDDGEGGIYVVNGTSDDKVNEVADGVANEEYVPGGSTYAANYDGFTFILPAGEGSVTIDEEVDEGYEFHLKIGTDAPITLKEGESGRAQAEIPFSVEEPTYCYLYMVEAHTYARAAARPYDDTRVGKRPQAHGKIFSVKVSPSKVNAANTPSQASGGIIPPSKEQGDIMELEGIQGVKVVQTTDDRWFTIDGRQIDKPTQKGLYIHNRKKVVVK